MNIPLAEQIRCVQRELRMRERVYPRMVQQGTLQQALADYELACMAAVLQTLENSHQLELFVNTDHVPHGDPA